MPYHSIVNAEGDALSAVIERVVRQLQATPRGPLSGEDTELESLWDEICAQQQTEPSFYWPVYQQYVEATVEKLVAELPSHELAAVWLLSDRGIDWRFEAPADAQPAPQPEEVVEFVVLKVLGKANDYSNSAIQAYCDRCYLD